MATKRATSLHTAWRFQEPAKPLINKDTDARHVGHEPVYPDMSVQNAWTAQDYQNALARSLNWYSKTQDRKTSTEWLVNFLSRNPRHEKLVQAIKRSNTYFPTNIGYLVRAGRVGLKLRYSTLKRIMQDLRAIDSTDATALAIEEAKTKAPVPNIQDRLREKAQDCMGEIEGSYDDFILAGCKGEPNIIGFLSQYNIQPAQIKMFQEQATSHCQEIESVLESSDSQLIEGYKQFGKRELKAMLGFWQKTLEHLNSYGIIKKANKAPRKKKPVTPEKAVSKLQFCREFADLKLKSIDATAILQAEELWVYNTKTRKLGIYVADSHAGKLSVKNSSIVGFSESQSQQKTLRKPELQLKEFSASGKPAAKKWFKAVKSVETRLTGRINADVILLKAFK
jgi:hypothetical protein